MAKVADFDKLIASYEKKLAARQLDYDPRLSSTPDFKITKNVRPAEPDLIVTAMVAVPLDRLLADRKIFDEAKAELRREVEAQLPEGYGEDCYDYAEYRGWYDAQTHCQYFEYEVHI